MSALHRFDLQIGGLAFDVRSDDSGLAAFVHEQTLGSWAAIDAGSEDAIQIHLITGSVPADTARGNTLMFGFGDNAIRGNVEPDNPSAIACRGIRLFCPAPRKIELTIASGRLNAFVALYRVVSTLLRDRVLRAGGGELHASAVSNGAQIVVFVGGKGAGKTSLCVDFVLSQGWNFVANDHVFLMPERETSVLALPETLRIGQGTLRQHPALFNLAKQLGSKPGEDDKTRLHVCDVAPHFDAPVVLNGQLAAIVTCGFQDGMPQGGVLSEQHLNRAELADCLTVAAGYERPQWLNWLDLPNPVPRALAMENIPTFDLRRAKGDTYAPLLLARSLSVSMQQTLVRKATI